MEKKEVKKIILIGLPNTGKSQVFGNITGEYTPVANYPFTTVEMKKGYCSIDGQDYELIDTPGLHCLYIHSEEELAVRDMLLTEKPDMILQCIDANRLKQSLFLTADLLELGIPMMISLNAIDETMRRGLWIDSEELARILGVPVVESVAINGVGTQEIMDNIPKCRRGKWGVRYGSIVENGISRIGSIVSEKTAYVRKLAVLLLLRDPFLMDFLKKTFDEKTISQVKEEVGMARHQFRGNLGRIINKKRHRWVDDITDKIIKKHKVSTGGFSRTFARLSRHPVFGIPILMAIVFFIFLLVVNVANAIAGWMDNTLWVPVEHLIDGFMPRGILKEFLIGNYGILSLGLANALLTVLPILSVFFLAFNVLEDIGYIPNLAVLTKRIFEKIGLSGSAIMPMVLGFGCKTMATLTTKSLRSKKERYISIYLIAFAIPCAAQMGLNMSILGRLGIRAFVITFFVLASVEVLAGLVLNKFIKEEKKGDFIQELPSIRMPNLKAVLRKTYYRLHHFLEEALPVFVMAAALLFVIDKIGVLGALKVVLSPVMENFLGLPVQMVDALILCMARHEAAAALIMNMIDKGQLNYVQCIVAVTITTMFVPCFANIMAMIKELGTKRALAMTLVINGSAFLFAGILNWTLVKVFNL